MSGSCVREGVVSGSCVRGSCEWELCERESGEWELYEAGISSSKFVQLTGSSGCVSIQVGTHLEPGFTPLG